MARNLAAAAACLSVASAAASSVVLRERSYLGLTRPENVTLAQAAFRPALVAAAAAATPELALSCGPASAPAHDAHAAALDGFASSSRVLFTAFFPDSDAAGAVLVIACGADVLDALPLGVDTDPAAAAAAGTRVTRVPGGALVEARLVRQSACALDAVLVRAAAGGAAAAQTSRRVPLSSCGVGYDPGSPTPYQIRAAFGPTGASSSLWLSWSSGASVDAAGKAYVAWGYQSGTHDRFVEGNCSTYVASDMCGPPANVSFITNFINPGYHCHIFIVGLLPDTPIFAIVGQMRGNSSGEIVVATAPAPGAAVTVAFAAFGDMALSGPPGASSTVLNVLGRARGADDGTPKLSFVSHFGDLGVRRSRGAARRPRRRPRPALLLTRPASTPLPLPQYAMGGGVLWELFMAYIEPLASVAPYMVGLGNHEQNHVPDGGSGGAGEALLCPQEPSKVDALSFNPPWPADDTNTTFGGLWGYDSEGEGGRPTWQRFRSPASSTASLEPTGPTPAGNGVFWYSVEMGALHYIQFSSEHNMTAGSAQYAWLAADLASVVSARRREPAGRLSGCAPLAPLTPPSSPHHLPTTTQNRSVTPWIVAACHRPLKNVDVDSSFYNGLGMTAALEPLFSQSGVALVLAGHYHQYQRTLPSLGLKPVPRERGGIVYVTVGTAGATTHPSSFRPDAEALLPPGCNMCSIDLVWGYGVVSANATHLVWQFVENEGKQVADEAVYTL